MNYQPRTTATKHEEIYRGDTTTNTNILRPPYELSTCSPPFFTYLQSTVYSPWFSSQDNYKLKSVEHCDL